MICHDWRSILDESCTTMTRLMKPGDYLWKATDEHDQQIISVRNGRGHVRWRVGETYAIQPVRTAPAIVWRQQSWIRTPHFPSSARAKQLFVADGWHELRICITDIQRHTSKVWRLDFYLVEPAHVES